MLLWSVILFNLIFGGGVFLQEVNSQGHHQSSIPYHLRPYFEVKDSAGQLHKNGLNEDWSDTSGRKDQQETRGGYDFIIVGGGTTGSVLASRLTENPKLKVLLLEAGQKGDITTDIPAGAFYLQGSSNYTESILAEPTKEACLGSIGGRCSFTTGVGLGGSSLTNNMLVIRGNSEDYDQWEEMGNKGWSYKDLLKYFKKAEKVNLNFAADRDYRSDEGPWSVETPQFISKQANQYLEAVQELDHDIIDFNGEHQIGTGLVQGSTQDGLRHSTASAYLYTVMKSRSNLQVLTGAVVKRILIDDTTKTAFGVEYLYKNRVRRAVANQEVILSAGTFRTPQLLMLSGVGPRVHLKNHGIHCKVNLPVGENLHDHLAFPGITFLINEPYESRAKKRHAGVQDQVLTSLGFEAVSFLKLRNSSFSSYYPDIELLMFNRNLNGLNLGEGLWNSMNLQPEIYRRYLKTTDRGHISSISLVIVPLQPKARGKLALRNKKIESPPIVSLRFLSEEEDMQAMLEGIKQTLMLLETDTMKAIGARLHNVPVPGCEEAFFGSEDYWRCAIRVLSVPFNDHGGTAKMGPASDQMAVVDEKLKVHGIKKLRVADRSVLPTPIAGHSQAIAIVLGEKLSEMILEDMDKQGEKEDPVPEVKDIEVTTSTSTTTLKPSPKIIMPRLLEKEKDNFVKILIPKIFKHKKDKKKDEKDEKDYPASHHFKQDEFPEGTDWPKHKDITDKDVKEVLADKPEVKKDSDVTPKKEKETESEVRDLEGHGVPKQDPMTKDEKESRKEPEITKEKEVTTKKPDVKKDKEYPKKEPEVINKKDPKKDVDILTDKEQDPPKMDKPVPTPEVYIPVKKNMVPKKEKGTQSEEKFDNIPGKEVVNKEPEMKTTNPKTPQEPDLKTFQPEIHEKDYGIKSIPSDIPVHLDPDHFIKIRPEDGVKTLNPDWFRPPTSTVSSQSSSSEEDLKQHFYFIQQHINVSPPREISTPIEFPTSVELPTPVEIPSPKISVDWRNFRKLKPKYPHETYEVPRKWPGSHEVYIEYPRPRRVKVRYEPSPIYRFRRSPGEPQVEEVPQVEEQPLEPSVDAPKSEKLVHLPPNQPQVVMPLITPPQSLMVELSIRPQGFRSNQLQLFKGVLQRVSTGRQTTETNQPEPYIAPTDPSLDDPSLRYDFTIPVQNVGTEGIISNATDSEVFKDSSEEESDESDESEEYYHGRRPIPSNKRTRTKSNGYVRIMSLDEFYNEVNQIQGTAMEKQSEVVTTEQNIEDEGRIWKRGEEEAMANDEKAAGGEEVEPQEDAEVEAKEEEKNGNEDKTPKVDAPKEIETPKVDAPKESDTPKVDAPMEDSPKEIETPKVDAPKENDTPKVDAPMEDEKKEPTTARPTIKRPSLNPRPTLSTRRPSRTNKPTEESVQKSTKSPPSRGRPTKSPSSPSRPTLRPTNSRRPSMTRPTKGKRPEPTIPRTLQTTTHHTLRFKDPPTTSTTTTESSVREMTSRKDPEMITPTVFPTKWPRDQGVEREFATARNDLDVIWTIRRKNFQDRFPQFKSEPLTINQDLESRFSDFKSEALTINQDLEPRMLTTTQNTPQVHEQVDERVDWNSRSFKRMFPGFNFNKQNVNPGTTLNPAIRKRPQSYNNFRQNGQSTTWSNITLSF